MKKLALSMRVTEAVNYYEIRNSIAFDYVEFFESLGFMITLIPSNTKKLNNYFEEYNFDGVVLTGGNNINPLLYNSKTNLDDVYNIRDKTENDLVNICLRKNIPILGICRGMQYLNVHFGGKISENIKGHVNNNHILISENKIFENKLKNSFHNHSILSEDVSNEFNIIATTNDNVVEAMMHKKYKILAIQWHPERKLIDDDNKLIKDFFI